MSGPSPGRSVPSARGCQHKDQESLPALPGPWLWHFLVFAEGPCESPAPTLLTAQGSGSWSQTVQPCHSLTTQASALPVTSEGLRSSPGCAALSWVTLGKLPPL